MYLKSLELSGFKSFAKKTELVFSTPITSIVGPNGSGKSNVAEAFRFVLGEQSIKSMRGKRGEDMIWNGSAKMARQNRASVKIVFDNSHRLLNMDFDEVVFERIVHRDGVNEYSINGTQVRLRDVMELLSGAHIGTSGHHIISQGEADRILNANSKERKLMIEDALGLKIYQYKKQESERKLEKTEENIASVQGLRKEIAPHIKFLKKQVEKIEKAKVLREDLSALYRDYLARESVYLANERKLIEADRRSPADQSKKIEADLAQARTTLEKSKHADNKSRELLELESELRAVRARKDELFRVLGRLEGEISAEERRLRKMELDAQSEESGTVPLREVRKIADEISGKIAEAEQASEIGALKSAIVKIKEIFSGFLETYRQKRDESAKTETAREIGKLKTEKAGLDEKLKQEISNEEKLNARYAEFKDQIEKEKDQSRDAEREVFRLMTALNEIGAALQAIKARQDRLNLEENEYNREMMEASALLGPEAIHFKDLEGSDAVAAIGEPRTVQTERRRHLEKIKIRMEEVGGGGNDELLREHREAEERDSFLSREIEDLEKSANSLKELIAELTTKLSVEFQNGVNKINIEFEKLFALMFGGGNASIETVRESKPRKRGDLLEEIEDMESGEPEEKETEEGIEVKINLPHKRIKGLEMLSGGERALTSIALLFAISQVNPPPFIILDETDAALDEANSRKYGDMIANLSKSSQLILITHNRETMSRAGVLYGVTMGSDGVSKLLSIAFEEAVAVAK